MNNRYLALIGVVVALIAMNIASSILNPVLLAAFIVIILVRPLDYLVKKNVSQGLAVTIVTVLLLVVYGLLLTVIGSSISMFAENAPAYADQLQQHTGSLVAAMQDKGLSLEGLTSALDPAKIMNYTAEMASGMGSMLSNRLTMLLLTIFLLAEVDVFQLKIKALANTSENSYDYLTRIADSIRDYLSIKTVTSLMTGALVVIGLWIIGVDYPILWGLIAFLLNYIPNIGSILAAIPTVILAFIQFGLMGVVWTGALYLSVNMVIGNVVEPKIMGKGLGLSTFVVFLGLIFWGFILGPMGMFLSVPLTIALKIALEQSDSTRAIALFLGTEEDIKLFNKKQD